jgi:hypothetical protein
MVLIPEEQLRDFYRGQRVVATTGAAIALPYWCLLHQLMA